MGGGGGARIRFPDARIYLSIVFGEITVDFVRFCPSVKRDIISDFFSPFSRRIRFLSLLLSKVIR